MKAADIESLRKKILVIYSTGSGIGKSEIAANLAFSIAQKGVRTWILDADTFAPKQDILFGLGRTGPTFSDFLLCSEPGEMPLYRPGIIHTNPHPLPLFITPSERDNQKTRFALQETLNAGNDIYSRIPAAVYSAMAKQKIDLLIIDTHPGFERLNEVWMGMTEFLLLISRINPVDLENLKSLMKDPSMLDIAQKLIVFTNVQVDRSRNVSQDMANEEIIEQLRALHRQFGQEPCTLGCADPPLVPAGKTAIHESAFLYSEKLALFQQAARRQGMFIDEEPEDDFSVNIGRLGEKILGITGKKD
jgi:MinD-like ATPase involved in chromosome partitioning or flagellar assembly